MASHFFFITARLRLLYAVPCRAVPLPLPCPAVLCCPRQEGLANVCLVGGSTTLIKAKIEVALPRKRGPAALGYDKAWNRFLEQVGPALRCAVLPCAALSCAALCRVGCRVAVCILTRRGAAS